MHERLGLGPERRQSGLFEDQLARVREVLHARGDVHRLAEIVERAVGGDDVTRARVHPQLDADGAAVLLRGAEALELDEGLHRRGHAVAGVGEGGHDGVAHRLHHHAVVGVDDLAEEIEVVVDEAERGGIADLRVERRRAGEVAEEHRHPRDLERRAALQEVGREELAEVPEGRDRVCRGGERRIAEALELHVARLLGGVLHVDRAARGDRDLRGGDRVVAHADGHAGRRALRDLDARGGATTREHAKTGRLDGRLQGFRRACVQVRLHEHVRSARRAAHAEHLLRDGAHARVDEERGLHGTIEVELERDVALLTVRPIRDLVELAHGLPGDTAAGADEGPTQLHEARRDGAQERTQHVAPVVTPLLRHLEGANAEDVGVGGLLHEGAELVRQRGRDAGLLQLRDREGDVVGVGEGHGLQVGARRLVADVLVDGLRELRAGLHEAAPREERDGTEEDRRRLQREAERRPRAPLQAPVLDGRELEAHRVRREDPAPHLAKDAERAAVAPLERVLLVLEREAGRLGGRHEAGRRIARGTGRAVGDRLPPDDAVHPVGVRDERPDVLGRRGQIDRRRDDHGTHA